MAATALRITELDTALAEAESQVPGLRPGCEKQILWAGEPGAKTATSLLFIHGFSATGQELRPLPDMIAGELGANLFFTRLTGHGQDGPAMAQATLDDWQRDVAEALEVAGILGDEVIVMGCSTGCTLATLALAEGAKARAVFFISPNFGLRYRVVQWLMDLPGAHRWMRYIAGRTRSFGPINDRHAAYWTTSYPTEAVKQMAEAVRAARRAELSQVTVPGLFVFNEADRVVSPDATRAVMARWGGPVQHLPVTPGPGDDAMGHIVAGETFSPGQTEPVARRILAWLTEH